MVMGRLFTSDPDCLIIGLIIKDTVILDHSGCGVGQLGGFSESETPDPIPNSAVKPLSAHDTAS